MEELVKATKPAWLKWRKDGGAWQDGECTDAAATSHDQEKASEPEESVMEVAPTQAGNESSVLELQLSNGVKLNVMRTKHQPKQCIARVTALGSEAVEKQGARLERIRIMDSWVVFQLISHADVRLRTRRRLDGSPGRGVELGARGLWRSLCGMCRRTLIRGSLNSTDDAATRWEPWDVAAASRTRG